MNSNRSNSVAGALKLSLSALAAAVAIAVPVATHAGDTATMVVSANVISQCDITAAGDMNFGDVDPLLGKDATATTRIRCNRGATVTLESNSTGIMAGSGGSALAYSLAVGGGALLNDCANSNPIGDGDLAVNVSALWGASGGPKDVTLCGTVTSGQDAALPVPHSETVTLTIVN